MQDFFETVKKNIQKILHAKAGGRKEMQPVRDWYTLLSLVVILMCSFSIFGVYTYTVTEKKLTKEVTAQGGEGTVFDIESMREIVTASHVRTEELEKLRITPGPVLLPNEHVQEVQNESEMSEEDVEKSAAEDSEKDVVLDSEPPQLL